jgi:hypothetical protein
MRHGNRVQECGPHLTSSGYEPVTVSYEDDIECPSSMQHGEFLDMWGEYKLPIKDAAPLNYYRLFTTNVEG